MYHSCDPGNEAVISVYWYDCRFERAMRWRGGWESRPIAGRDSPSPVPQSNFGGCFSGTNLLEPE